MVNIIVKVKDATFIWAVHPNVHHDAVCHDYHGSIVHPRSSAGHMEHGIKIIQTIALGFVTSPLPLDANHTIDP
jgi:hypothetical protein